MRASYPERLNCAPQCSPTSDFPRPPLMGDLAPIACRALPPKAIPVTGPVAKTSLFSGPRGSIPGNSSRNRWCAINPTPPRYRRQVDSSTGSAPTVPLLRLTRRSLPWYPPGNSCCIAGHLSFTDICRHCGKKAHMPQESLPGTPRFVAQHKEPKRPAWRRDQAEKASQPMLARLDLRKSKTTQR